MSGTRVDWTRLTVERHTDFDVTEPHAARLPQDAQDEQDELNNLNIEPGRGDDFGNPCPECDGELEKLPLLPGYRCSGCGHMEPL